jgi:glycosyltransferase involved in cell wall biosynthesis
LTLNGGAQIKVIFGTRTGLVRYFDKDFATEVVWQLGLVDGFDHEFIAGAPGAEIPHSVPDVPARSVSKILTAYNPDVVQIYGLGGKLARAAYFWALQRRRKLLYFSDSENRQSRPWSARVKKRLLMPALFLPIDGFLTIGDWNEWYYRSYGVPRRKLFRCPYPIDSPTIAQAVKNRAQHRQEIRKLLCVPDDALLAIVVGKLIARKRPADAIRSVSMANRISGHAKIVVTIVGSGPDRQILEALADSEGRENVRFADFVPVLELPRYYMAADILIHPASADPHPLAVGEAITAGLPVIISDRIGCVGPTDDVRPGQNGLEFSCGNIDSLTRALLTLAGDEEARASMAAASLRIAQHRSLQMSTAGFLTAVRSVAS